ncbi:hypothetical protein TUSST3_40350 [Streptomyces sp. TUS-ST3]|nr:hypothetical protein TUSST3_40350 [Streptomyces sp. TUS-ST3]
MLSAKPLPSGPGTHTHSSGRNPARSAERHEAAHVGEALPEPDVTGGQQVRRRCVGPASLEGRVIRPGRREEGAAVGQGHGTGVTAGQGAVGDQGQRSMHLSSINLLIHIKQA